VVRDEDEAAARREAASLARGLEPLLQTHRAAMRGPTPCPIARLADRWRFQIELFGEASGPLQSLLAEARTRGLVVPGERVAVDVDPVSLM